jgi:hypothetical protein
MTSSVNMLVKAGLDITSLLDRHFTGDWGDVDAHDHHQNGRAIEFGDRIVSSYTIESSKTTILIVTDAETMACWCTMGLNEDCPGASVGRYENGSHFLETSRRLATTVMLPSEY